MNPFSASNFNHFKMLISGITLLSVIGFTGCVKQSNVKPQSAITTQATEQIPNWVKTPPADNATSIFGLGEGDSLESARQSALKDIAGKLETHVKSETENRAFLRNDQISSSFEQNIQTQVKDTKLVSYEMIKSAHVNGRTYALLAMSRGDFVKDKQHRLNEINEQITQLLSSIKSKSKLEQMIAYNKAFALATEARPYVYIIRAVDAGFDSKPYLKAFDSYQQKEQQLAESIRFYIKSPSELNKVAKYIRDALQTYNFQVTDTKASADAIISLTGEIKKNVIFSSKTVAIVYDMLVSTPQGQLLSKKHFRLNGSSVTNYDVAFETALRQLRTQVETKASLFDMLGLKAQ